MDVLGTTLGLLYLVLEMKENIWMWVVGSIMPVIYIFVLYEAGIYADCGMEVYYFLAGVYGFVVWLRGGKREKKPVSIGYTPASQRLPLLGITAFLWLVLTLFLSCCTDSRVPVADGFTTAASIVGLWMLSRKYMEQWWVWFVVDAVSVGLYLYKGVYGRALLYAIYTVMALYGYHVWRNRLRAAQP
ncbi:MAG: nicotinamide mononucleotide transporter [Bacteroidaceae bacterium]|nr:nicotinamide mononucleotide transporter [Bacteroidaceae bacterium]